MLSSVRCDIALFCLKLVSLRASGHCRPFLASFCYSSQGRHLNDYSFDEEVLVQQCQQFLSGIWYKIDLRIGLPCLIKNSVLVSNCGPHNFQNVSKNSLKCIQKPSKYQNVYKMSPKCLQKLSKTKMSPKSIRVILVVSDWVMLTQFRLRITSK